MCKDLTPNQEAYARGVLFERKTKRQAYRDAYPKSVNASDEAVDRKVQDLQKNLKFSSGFERLQAEAERAMNITRDDVLRELACIGFSEIDDKRISIKDKLSALAQISKILGYDQKQTMDVTVSEKPKVPITFPDDGRGGYE